MSIKLDITKAACFLEAGAVKSFEPKVKPLKRLWKMAHALVTIS